MSADQHFCPCPNGAPSSSPGLAHMRLPWECPSESAQPQRGCALSTPSPGHNPVGVAAFVSTRTQGRRCASTLGYWAQSRWDWGTVVGRGCFRASVQASPHNHAGGVAAISRGLSAATPPVSSIKKSGTLKGCQRLELHSVRHDLGRPSGTPSGCGASLHSVPGVSARTARLNPRLMAGSLSGCYPAARPPYASHFFPPSHG
jgi:hypothetical protein